MEADLGSYSSYEVPTFPARKHSVHTYVVSPEQTKNKGKSTC